MRLERIGYTSAVPKPGVLLTIMSPGTTMPVPEKALPKILVEY